MRAQLDTPEYANSTSGSYNFRSVPGMKNYLFIAFNVDVGNLRRTLVIPNGIDTQQYLYDQGSTSYIRGGFYCDWKNQRIYVRYLECKGYTYKNVHVSGVFGICKIK